MKALAHWAIALFLVTTSASVSADRIIAQGQYAKLSEDNAIALLEATQFVMQQLGAGDVMANLEQHKALEEMARIFPQASQDEQQVLSQARQLWTQAQIRWPTMSLQEKREFAYDVLTLSLGTQTANQLLGGSPAAGGSSTNNNSYGGMPSVDSGYEGSSCWASAGCTGYDADSGTYNYETYDSGGYSD